MKRHIQKTGIRKYFGKDFTELQGEPLKALDGFFAEYGECIITGCEIVAAGDKCNVSAGLVALEATDPETGVSGVKVMPFDGATSVVLPLYLSVSVNPVERVYGDGKVKPIAYDYKAVGSTVKPEGKYIAITIGGGNRFVDAIQDPKHQFTTDTEKATWNAKETPAAAQAKATAAETNAKAYADTKVGEVNTSLGTHTGDSTRHITATERNSWNAKETPAGAQTKATAAETNAKAYTDIRESVINAALDTKLNITAITLPAEHDLNTAYQGGFYCVLNAVNAPSTGWIYLHVIRYADGAGWVSQTIYTFGVSNTVNKIYHRNGYNDSSWSPWVELWHSGNFDPTTKADVKHTHSATFKSYTNDGLFNDNADPVVVETVSNQKILFGYRDYGNGQYCPRIGFIQKRDPVNSPVVTPATASIGLNASGRFIYSPDNISAEYDIYHAGNFDPATKADASHVNDNVKHITSSERAVWNDSIINRGLRVYLSPDTLIDTGYYFVTTPSFGTLIVVAAYIGRTHPMQIFVPFDKSGISTRSYNSDTQKWSQWVEMWHSGNFDPAAKASLTTQLVTISGGADKIPYSLPNIAKLEVIGINYASLLNLPDGIGKFNQLKIVGYAGQEDISFRTQVFNKWRTLYHSGNFDPDTKINYTDLMYPDAGFQKPQAKNGGSIALGNGAKAIMTNSIAIGKNVETIRAGQVIIGGHDIGEFAASRQLTVTSDARDKTNIHDMDSDTAQRLIMSLRPVEFNRNDRGDYRTGDTLTDEDGNIVNYDAAAHSAGEKAGKRTNIGFIAQEVQQALKDITGGDGYGALISDTAFDNDKITSEGSRLGIAYSNLIAPMVSVIQKLSAKIDQQGAEIESLKNTLQGDIATESAPEPETTPEQEPEQPVQPETDNSQTNNTENNGTNTEPLL